MKKALVLCTGAFHTDGGIAAVNRLMIKAITDKGFSLDVFSLLEVDPTIDTRYLPPGAEVHYRGFAGHKIPFSLAAWRAIFLSSYAYVFVDHVNLASLLSPFTWLNRCKYVVWLCGIEVFPPNPDREGRLGLMGAWQRLAISEYTRQIVIDRFPKLPVDVCELALDPVRHPNISFQSPLSNSATPPITLEAVDGSTSDLADQVILHVGRMVLSNDRYKGQESLIRSFPLIRQQFPHAQLVLVGQGENMGQIRALAEALPAADQGGVFMPGLIADRLLDQIYRRCYVFAMPSIGEGFGLVYLEAMSRAKPCLGGKTEATPLVVREDVTGLLVDNPRSAEQVAQKLAWLLAHPQAARNMGQAGYELVQSNYLYSNFKQRFWHAVLPDLT